MTRPAHRRQIAKLPELLRQGNDWLGFFNRNRLSINLPERLPVPREVLDFATRRGPPFFSSSGLRRTQNRSRLRLGGLSFARLAARLGSCTRIRKRAIFESGEGAMRIDGSVS